ncbi:MAG: HAD family hydrolase [Anaerolineae bacterium]|nr:HAD family hydrolase [Anaerolineae bacterium]
MLQALIFDFDGLIMDTETPVLQSWQALYADYGQELPVSEWLKCIGAEYGPDTFDPFAYLEARVDGPLDWEALQARRRARELEIVAGLAPLPGVTALLDDAQAHGIRLAIGSSSPHKWVDAHLARLGLLDRFEVVICADDVAQVKPAPDLFLKAAGALDVPVSGAVVLEDSPHGIQAARTAGIFSVAVPNDLTHRLDFSQANMRVQSLAELSVDLLNRALHNSAPAV